MASSMLTAVYYMLRRDEPDRDLGPQHFDTLAPTELAARLARRIEALGFQVTLQPTGEAA